MYRSDVPRVVLAELRLHEEQRKPGFAWACVCGSFARRGGFDVHLAGQIAVALDE